uniref:Uncharacterized protein n=1 Tax=Arundo donax TaxID=35708 RepID=A0A0A9BTW0_ARUDO
MKFETRMRSNGLWMCEIWILKGWLLVKFEKN